VAVVSGEGPDFGEFWLRRRPRKRGAIVGTAVALTIHTTVAVALVQVDTARLFSQDRPVEVEIQEPKPPPPEVRPEPPPPPPPPEVKPRIAMRKAAVPPPTAAPPPPSEAPPKADDPPPMFGVSLDSTVAGDGPGMAVPVGNTLMTKPTKKEPGPPPPKLSGGGGDGLPAPVPEVFISERPQVANQVYAVYPEEMRRMGIEGHVIARLYIDENGDVKRVTITERAGHGFDEAAKEALKKFKFTPARTSDGKAVPTNITYKYSFELPQ
jgi:protein TonB